MGTRIGTFSAFPFRSTVRASPVQVDMYHGGLIPCRPGTGSLRSLAMTLRLTPEAARVGSAA